MLIPRFDGCIANMGLRNIVALVLCFGYVIAQDFFEERHKYRVSQMEHLKEIPRRFEVKGQDAKIELQRYVKDIEDLAKKENVTVTYRIRVDKTKPMKKRHLKKLTFKKNLSKKYNIPLKKKSMKLSNFEVFLRKMAEDNGQTQQKLEDYMTTTNAEKIVYTTKQPTLKYKPIIKRFKTNYTKVVKPVRSKLITLN